MKTGFIDISFHGETGIETSKYTVGVLLTARKPI